ncbi:MAG: PaaI family thioesterase [Alphaproteobacteria bacterium]|nr:PaaI family thioesterase [Alphaproteobacteria bacterium]
MTLDPEIEAKVRASFARQSLMTTLGTEIADLGPGSVLITAPILAISQQQHGAAHAGLAFSIGDTAAGYAALTLFPPEAEVMTVEMKISLLRPATGERLLAEGSVVKPGRRVSFVRAEIHAETGQDRRHVATLQGTMIPV